MREYAIASRFGDRRKEILGDIATLTGARVISPELGHKLENVKIEDLGSASRVVIDKDSTAIIGGGGDKRAIADRVERIRRDIRETKSDYDKEKLQERLAKLTGGVAVIRVGAATEAEQKSRKEAFEDAVSATKAAVAEGIVPGGGLALLRAIEAVKLEEAACEGDMRAGDGFSVPSDPSSSSFLVAAALLAGAREVRLPNICVNPTRTGFLDAIAAMGGVVTLEDRDDHGPEPIATLVVRGAAPELHATEISGDLAMRSIDELPILAVLAARARGTTIVRDAAELRVKESDRIATTCAMLAAFGIACEARPDGFTVEGRPDRPLDAAHVHAEGDHRIAMAAAIGGLVAAGPTHIADADNVATSYPGFAAAIQALGGNVTSA